MVTIEIIKGNVSVILFLSVDKIKFIALWKKLVSVSKDISILWELVLSFLAALFTHIGMELVVYVKVVI